jgi:Tfp pilus assembly protein PilO
VKAKIFIVPLLIAMMIGMVIWLIGPDFSAMLAERDKLKIEEEKLVLMQKKNEQAVKLGVELQNSSEQKSILQKYVPPARQEEEMMNSLYTLASAEGLTVSDLSFIAGNDKLAAPAAVPVEIVATSGSVPTENAVSVAANPVASDFQVSIGVLGGYEKIRLFLNKAASLKRFSNVDSLKISEVSSSANSEENPAPSGSLQVDLVFRFNYFMQNDLIGVDADSSIFSSGKFDMDIISSIRSKLSTEILGVNVDSAGRANPFLP